MNQTSDVISAFVDDEPFDAGELAAALSTPTGREALIDSIALRHLVQPRDRDVVAFASPPKRSAWRAVAAAAVLLVALAGGYLFGQRRTEASAEIPAPTRVIDAAPMWQDVTVRSPR
jgi:hypothetical protein